MSIVKNHFLVRRCFWSRFSLVEVRVRLNLVGLPAVVGQSCSRLPSGHSKKEGFCKIFLVDCLYVASSSSRDIFICNFLTDGVGFFDFAIFYFAAFNPGFVYSDDHHEETTL